MILSTIAQQLGSSLGRAAVKPTPQPAAPARTPAPAISSPVAPTNSYPTAPETALRVRPAPKTTPTTVTSQPAAARVKEITNNTNALANAVAQQSGYASADPTIQATIAEMQRQAVAQSSQAPSQPAAFGSAAPTTPVPAPSAPTQQAKTYWEPVLGQYVQGDIDVDKPWQKYGLGSANALYNTDVNTLKALAAGNQNRGIDVGAAGQTGEYTKPVTPAASIPGEKPAEPQKYQGEIGRLDRESEDLYNKYKADVEKLRTGTLPLSESQLAQLDTIKQQFDAMIEDQRVYNQNYTNLMERAGTTAGRSKYAPQIALGEVKKTVDDGLAKIRSINAQAIQTMFDVKQAMQQENWRNLDAAYAKLDKHLQDRKTEFKQMQKDIQAAAEKLADAKRQSEQDKIAYSKEVAPGLADGLTYLKSDGSIYQPTEDEILASAKTSGIDANILRSNVQKQASKIREDQKKKADKELEDLNKDKRDLLDSAAKNSAPQSVINAINKATTYAEAIQAGGDYLANATGIIGEYNLYKRDEQTAGRIPMSFSAFQDADANRKILAATVANSQGLTPGQERALDSIATKHISDPLIKAGLEAERQYALADQVLANPKSASEQIKALYLFVKGLDQNSAVREGEVALAQQTQSLLGRLGTKVEGVFTGKVISDSVAKDLAEQVKLLADATIQVAEKQENKMRALAKGRGVGDAFEAYLKESEGLSDVGALLNKNRQTLDDFYVANPDKQGQIDALSADPRNFTDEQILQIIQDGFKPVGSDTKPAVPVKKTGMRTDRHNNPTAFTTDIARIGGLREGVDYVKGDPFDNGRFHTARLLGDPVATTIKVIDNIGFYTQGGKQRWSHTAIPQDRWNAMTYEQKKQVVKKMYGHEGGKELNNIFA